MANISDAFGSIEIKGSKEAIESILRLFEISDSWTYNTSIDPESIEKPTDDTCTVNFYGTGRCVTKITLNSSFAGLMMK